VASLSHRLFSPEKGQLRKFGWLLAYMPYFLYREIVAHLEVISLIFSGRIKPGIVEVNNPHKSDFGTTALANSITLTPGTVTLELDSDKLYVHWLRMKEDKNAITSGYERFLCRIWS
jgi:multicomponent Na+:H+ antiporter subunit E